MLQQVLLAQRRVVALLESEIEGSATSHKSTMIRNALPNVKSINSRVVDYSSSCAKPSKLSLLQRKAILAPMAPIPELKINVTRAHAQSQEWRTFRGRARTYMRPDTI